MKRWTKCFLLFIFLFTAATVAMAQDSVIVEDPEEYIPDEVQSDTTVYSTEVVVDPSDPDTGFDRVVAEDNTPVAERGVDGNSVSKMRKDEDFWYVDQVKEKPKPKEVNTKESFFSKLLRSTWFEPLIWIFVIGFILFLLVWFLASSDVRLFHRQPVKLNTTEEENENIHEINFETAISNAVNAGNYRLAVRLMYLQLLKHLSDKNVIRYSLQKPNSEYVMQLYGTNYYQDFFRITRNFEYAWYGGFHVSPFAFETISADVKELKNRIS